MASFAAPKDEVPVWTDPKKADVHPQFAVQGEYLSGEGESKKGIQVAALDGGKYHVLTYGGGLPGDGWDGIEPVATLVDEADIAEFKKGAERVERESPTLGAAPPEGAVVLFDGEKNDRVKGEIADGLLWAGSETTVPMGDFSLHLEFRLPYKPARLISSQDRGNSGVYLFDNYEIQVIDTFGLSFAEGGNAIETESANTQWCASFYKFKTPDVPMSYPPLRWQTYDIDFTAPRFENGEKVENARITVRHNGVLVHDDVELPKGTGAGGNRPEKEKGTILFQGHGNPVAFRNVWAVEK